ncbi:MAG: DUF1329 domain-containing protein [Candidatus Binataceae bacterium]
MKTLRLLSVIALAVLVSASFATAQMEENSPNQGIPPGTVINMKNWRTYKQYMTHSMEVLFSGQYFWKFPPDFYLEVGQTKNYPMGSKPFIDATKKYNHLVKIVNLPSGGHNITGYVAGIPFPNPSGPLKGWQVLVDDWYAFQPYIICSSKPAWYHIQDRYHNVSTESIVVVFRRVGHTADDDQPLYNPKAPGEDFTEWAQVLSPEQARYTATITIYYLDLSKPEDTYLFIPALRRTLRLSTAARCSPLFGTDVTYDDARHGAFNGNVTIFDADFLGDKKVLMMPEYNNDMVQDIKNLYQPVFFPKPFVGKWQLRDSWNIDVHRIPAYAKGYCYGKRILYVDKQSFQSQWADLYDANNKFWKVDLDPQDMLTVPGEGTFWTNNGVSGFWDMQNDHMTSLILPFTANDGCRNVQGRNFTDMGRYGSVGGLSQIMR